MASVTSEMTQLTTTDQDSGSDQDFDLNSDNLYTDVGKQLRKAKQRLCGPDCKPLDVLGTVNLTLTLNNKSCTQQTYIIRNLRSNLLGLPAIRQLPA